MYLLDVAAVVSKEYYQEHKETHGAWVKEGFDKGFFILAGPKKDELGGFVLVNDIDKRELMDFISEDPFVIEEVAKYEIHSFSVGMAKEELKQVINI